MDTSPSRPAPQPQPRLMDRSEVMRLGQAELTRRIALLRPCHTAPAATLLGLIVDPLRLAEAALVQPLPPRAMPQPATTDWD